jgi:heme/copper-type cytochrome/quinol oxidase subunit 2
MSHEERNVLTELLTNLIIIALFVVVLLRGTLAGDFDGPQGPQVWAVVVLKLIGASIAIGIVLAVLSAIIWHIVTGERSTLTRDERDRAIAGTGWRWAMIGSAIGFVGGIIALALGQGVIFALNLMLAGCALGDTFGNMAKFRAYRLGL